MKLRNLLLACCCLLASIPCAHASAPMPCITATLSANSNILVLNQLAYDDPDETHPRRPRSSTYRVFERHQEINRSQRVNGPDTYWSDPLWSLVFTAEPNFCSYALVTDDAEYLILLASAFTVTQPALSIYRRRDHPGQPFGGPGPDTGVFIRKVPLTELWPAEHIPNGVNEGTPEWFAEGSFAFSPDNQTLIHKTRWNQTFAIELATGKVTKR